MDRVLITGSNGFIGSHLVDELCRRAQCRVVCMLRKNSDCSWLNGRNLRFVFADFRDKSSLEKALVGVDAVYHVGGVVRSVKKSSLYKINSAGTKRLVEAVRKTVPQLKKFVYVSSQAAWGPSGRGPVSDYGKSKKEGEEAVKGLPNYKIVRPAAVYGPRDRDFLDLFKGAVMGVFLKPSRAGKISFIHVRDCVRGILDDPRAEAFLSDGESYSWEDVRKAFEYIVGRRVLKVTLPSFLALSAAVAGDAFGRLRGRACKINSDKIKEIMAGSWLMPPPVLKAEFKLKEGFSDTWNWYKKNGWI